MAVFLAEPIADTLAVLTTVTMFILFFKKLLRGMQDVDQMADSAVSQRSQPDVQKS